MPFATGSALPAGGDAVSVGAAVEVDAGDAGAAA